MLFITVRVSSFNLDLKLVELHETTSVLTIRVFIKMSTSSVIRVKIYDNMWPHAYSVHVQILVANEGNSQLVFWGELKV